MKVSRWERERAAWLLNRSKQTSVRRRRSKLLSRQANRLTRGGSGVGESDFHSDVPDRLFTRLMTSDDGAADRVARMIIVPAVYGAVWLAVGGAIAVAAAIYRALWSLAPRIGRLWDWPWYVAAAAAGVGGGLLLDHGSPVEVSVWPRYLVLHVDWGQFWGTWLWVQFSLGLLLAGIYIHESGWAAVPRRAVRKPETDKHGRYIETPDKKKIRLDPLAGADEHFEAIEPVPAITGGEKPVCETVIEPDLADDEEGPVFADDEEGAA
ncbi:MAG: hypothetical protein ACTH2Q_01490 [Propionibacteriaceae bacterium]